MTDHDSIGAPTPRRGFLRRIAAGATMLGGGLTIPVLLRAESQPDDDWMKALTGKHRTVFDLATHRNGKPLAQAKNFLDGWRDAFHVPETQVNLVIGVHGDGIPIVLSDALWSRFHLGEQYDVTDPATRSPATKNLFTVTNVATPGLVSAEQSVEGLQKRGVRFIVCMNTIAAATAKLSAAGFGTPPEIRAALLGNLLPGVMTVPAMVVALAQLQERGLTYTKIA